MRLIAKHKILNKIANVSKIDFLCGTVHILKPNGEEIKTPWQLCDVIIKDTDKEAVVDEMIEALKGIDEILSSGLIYIVQHRIQSILAKLNEKE